MNPVLVLIPAVALVLGPQLWVNHVLKRNNRRDQRRLPTGRELARELLDSHNLYKVRVESTDLGDHYDPQAKAVRLSRDKIDRRTLTAVTTAAHEVGHAIQHATGYAPFVWRTRMARVAQVTGQAGSAMLIAAPIAALVSRDNPIPPILIGVAAFAMLGTGVLAQLSALPTELDASFARALPMLKAGEITRREEKDARTILTACSMTYLASSLAGLLTVWRWLPVGPAATSPVPRARALRYLRLG